MEKKIKPNSPKSRLKLNGPKQQQLVSGMQTVVEILELLNKQDAIPFALQPVGLDNRKLTQRLSDDEIYTPIELRRIISILLDHHELLWERHSQYQDSISQILLHARNTLELITKPQSGGRPQKTWLKKIGLQLAQKYFDEKHVDCSAKQLAESVCKEFLRIAPAAYVESIKELDVRGKDVLNKRESISWKDVSDFSHPYSQSSASTLLKELKIKRSQ